MLSVKITPCSLKLTASLCGLLVLFAVVGLTRCWNAPEVFVAGRTFFIDADCYSRMTRVRQVVEHPGTVIHRHDFENWPEGTQPHTTAPFDELVAGLTLALRPMVGNTEGALDWAGALVSPLLALATALFLWLWAGRLKLRFRAAMLILFAASPILVHGTALGRPDHQSLLLLCLAVALGAEAALWREPSKNWALAAGLAWGMGLWVSLYEPGILWVGVIGLGLLLNRPAFFARERRWEWLGMGGVLAVATLVDGWRWPVPDATVIEFFPNWSRSIGELNRTPLSEMVRWCGWMLPFAPLLLAWRCKTDKAAGFWLGLLLLTAALTAWQARWGYFLALVFAMSLPWQLAVFSRRWMAVAALVLSLLPLCWEWRPLLFPNEAEIGLRLEQRMDNLALYDVAQQLRGAHRLPVLAPWWQSPALAYWSGQPCVAGSSHESLPGTVDSARFYLSTDPQQAEAILARRKVACVVAYEPTRVLATSKAILCPDVPLSGADLEQTTAALLYRRPHSPPPYLDFAYRNRAFCVFLRPGGLESR